MIQWRLRYREAALSLSRARDTRSPPLDLPEATPLNLAFAYGMFRNDVLDFSRQLIAGVAYLHGRGIAYLDIKPQNIVVRVRWTRPDGQSLGPSIRESRTSDR